MSLQLKARIDRAGAPRPVPYGGGLFSPVAGGLLWRLGERVGLVRHDPHDALRASLAFVLLMWVPSVALAIAARLSEGTWPRAFLAVELHVRPLVTVPLLFVAARIVHRRSRRVLRYLARGGYLPESRLTAYRSHVAILERLRDSPVPEGLLVLVALATTLRGGLGTGAAAWAAAVSATLLRVLLLWWVWHWLLWTALLWRVARLGLRVEATHPDLAGGLLFLGQPTAAFGIVLSAFAFAVAASSWTRVLFEGETLVTLAPELVAFVVLGVLVAFVPLLGFSPNLARARRRGIAEYGVVARRLGVWFATRWVERPEAPPSLPAEDFSTMADMTGTYASVLHMRPFAFSPALLVGLAASAALPILPLVFTQIPIQELVKRLASLL